MLGFSGYVELTSWQQSREKASFACTKSEFIPFCSLFRSLLESALALLVYVMDGC
jgi:hypothetical protein